MYSVAHEGEPPTGDLHPMNSRPCRAYTPAPTRTGKSAALLYQPVMRSVNLHRTEATLHPNAYLRGFWRNALKPQVFVAMSFDPRYDERYTRVIKPAIEESPIEGRSLTAFRVNESRTGDSILT